MEFLWGRFQKLRQFRYVSSGKTGSGSIKRLALPRPVVDVETHHRVDIEDPRRIVVFQARHRYRCFSNPESRNGGYDSSDPANLRGFEFTHRFDDVSPHVQLT